MKFLNEIQQRLEEHYGAVTGLDVCDFVRETENFSRLGELLVEQSDFDLNVALLLDRDIFAAWAPRATPSLRQLSVPFEEVSHFVYLSFNHARCRNVTRLEMEMQSEVDRILLAYHGGFAVPVERQRALLGELMESRYTAKDYEEARRAAAAFVYRLSGGNPAAWTRTEFAQLRRFFHSDLSEKLNLVKTVG